MLCFELLSSASTRGPELLCKLPEKIVLDRIRKLQKRLFSSHAVGGLSIKDGNNSSHNCYASGSTGTAIRTTFPLASERACGSAKYCPVATDLMQYAQSEEHSLLPKHISFSLLSDMHDGEGATGRSTTRRSDAMNPFCASDIDVSRLVMGNLQAFRGNFPRLDFGLHTWIEVKTIQWLTVVHFGLLQSMRSGVCALLFLVLFLCHHADLCYLK